MSVSHRKETFGSFPWQPCRAVGWICLCRICSALSDVERQQQPQQQRTCPAGVSWCVSPPEGWLCPPWADLAGALQQEGTPTPTAQEPALGATSSSAAGRPQTWWFWHTGDNFTDEIGLKLAITGLMKVNLNTGRLLGVWYMAFLLILLWDWFAQKYGALLPACIWYCFLHLSGIHRWWMWKSLDGLFLRVV